MPFLAWFATGGAREKEGPLYAVGAYDNITHPRMVLGSKVLVLHGVIPTARHVFVLVEESLMQLEREREKRAAPDSREERETRHRKRPHSSQAPSSVLGLKFVHWGDLSLSMCARAGVGTVAGDRG